MDEPLRLPPLIPPEGKEILRAGGDVDSCSVCMRVYGEALEPDSVSALLRAKPTSACRKGDIHRGKRYDRIEKQGMWLLRLEHVRGIPLDDLLNRLLDRLTNDLAAWRELHQSYRADLFCGLQLELWNRGLSLSPRTLQRVAERGLELGLDIYYVGECSPDEPSDPADAPRESG